MKLWYDRKSKDPTYFVQKGYRNGKKTTTKMMEYQRFIRNRQIERAKDILAVSSKRYKIEDCFRVMKTNFGARPVFHQTREHITAHFIICYTALLIYRLLEKEFDLNKTHFTVDNIIETLQNMEAANLEDLCYMSTYTCSQVCTALNAVSGLRLDKKYYQPKEFNKKILK